MHILITNDDGIQAPGLKALAQALLPLGQVSILAPDRNWSASGHVKTMERPLRVKEVHLIEGITCLATDGAPSDCVALAVLGILAKEPQLRQNQNHRLEKSSSRKAHLAKIDLVVSGINPNANLGDDVTYSGTVTAAMEAAIWNIRGIAISLNSPPDFQGVLDYQTAARVANRVVSQVIEHGLPNGTLLNVNVPYLPYENLKGWMITRQGLRVYRDQLVRRKDPRGRPYYWIGGQAPTGVPDEGTDIGALAEGYVSITPLHLDMTAYQAMDTLRDWGW